MHILPTNIVIQQINRLQGFIAYFLSSKVQASFSVKGNNFYNFLLINSQVALRVQIFISQLPKSYDSQQYLQSTHLSTLLPHDY